MQKLRQILGRTVKPRLEELLMTFDGYSKPMNVQEFVLPSAA